MKRSLWVLLLVVFIGCASVQAAVLPIDVETFTPLIDEQGETYLEWNGPVLPAGTTYELLETVVTGYDCKLASRNEIAHKFARISYQDAQGDAQEAWVMAHHLNRALLTHLDNEEEAQNYARRFFTNQYVLAASAEDSIQMTQLSNGWRAELLDSDGAVTHELTFRIDGQVIQYLELGYQSPDVSHAVIHDDGLAEDADVYGAHGVLEWSSRELLPEVGYNSVATIDRTGDVFTFIIDGFDYYVALEVEPVVRMVAYGDMQLGASYGDYLNRAEALELATLALMRECHLLPEEASTQLMTLQSNFCAKPYQWTNAYVPLPYWCFQMNLVPASETEDIAQYQVIINAADGGVLEISDPAAAGNG